MSIFSQLKQQLSEQLAKQASQQGLIELQASVCLSDENVAFLAGLNAQKNIYPHFFLKNRDRDQTITALGAVKTFQQLETAQAFIQQTRFPLIGGLQFEGKCYFVLPRLKLVKEQQNLIAYFYLDLSAETSQAVNFDDYFAPFLAEQNELAPLSRPFANKLIDRKTACDFEGWQANINKAINEIQAQHFSKVVLANAICLTFDKPISAYELLEQSQKINLGCYHFLWAENSETAFVGSTPERLYLRQARNLYTEALAGTVAVTEDLAQTEQNAQWLLNDTKNVYENQLVVDDITRHLEDCVEQIEIGKAEIKRLHNVQHLRRKIQAVLKPTISDSECLIRIHPTAAVAGLPRAKAKQFIAENEPFTRGWYAGTLGIWGEDEAEFCVALRSAQIKQNQVTLYAGAGIVQDSEPLSEWQEIERKSQALAKLLSYT
ncbi:isochorismate synthase [Actinobacillus minor]|uniref:isochorismate synthase n=1 Tax=Actinobacillus minor TaxID=51047 RepID=UPI0023F060A4|nr:isochorismate synthase [Actinobacillus minor]MDD6911746.1 isochorismate synthase [Actinobacillus minor]